MQVESHAEGQGQDGSAPRAQGGSAFGRELQQLWFSLAPRPWRSIVLLPIDPSSAPTDAMATLASMAEFYELGAFKYVDARGFTLAQGSKLAREMAEAEAVRWVVAVNPVAESPGAIPVMMEADAALLFVRLRITSVQAVNDAVNVIGRDKVLGAVAVR